MAVQEKQTVSQVHDLRSALALIEANGELVRIKREVDPLNELPNVARNASLQPKRPALLFENIKGFPGVRVATSTMADPRRISYMFNLPVEPLAFKERVVELLEQGIPPVVVDEAPCQENVVTENIDLRTLIPSTHGALHVDHRYFQGPIISRDPRTGRQNVAMYRTCLQGPDTVTVNGRWDRHFGLQLSDAKRAQETRPVAIVLGPDPLWIPIAGSKLPYGSDDFAFAGAVRGRPVELVHAKTVDLMVPAEAEIIIEGELRPPYEHGDDGPWPEYLRYLGMNIHPPLVHVTAVTYRNNPITHFSIPAGTGDNNGVFIAPQFLRHLRNFLSSFIVDAGFVRSTIMHHAVIKVRKTESHHEGLQLNAALAAFGFLVEIDRVTIVDEDIDINDLNQIAWAEATRCNPATQIHKLCEARSHQNNPIAGVREMFDLPLTKEKVIVDATVPWKYKIAEKSPGVTFFTQSEWAPVDLGDYFAPEDAERWVKNQADGTIKA